MRAADSLGRRVWEFEVDANDDALWLDHRKKQYCQVPAASQLAIAPLARLPLDSLPKLLLGHLPAAPASEFERTDTTLTETTLQYRDARGYLWNGGMVEGRLERWTLVEDAETVSWWRREGDESLFVDRKGGQRLRWREVVRERLTEPVPRLSIPGKFERIDCAL